MRLADFIEANIDEIVDRAEEFASTVGSVGGRLDSEALRDHIPQMLAVIVADLRTGQTPEHAREKSEGRYAPASDATRTAAQTHAGTRATQGFDVIQMVSEYRAFRAIVLRMWTDRYESADYSIGDIHRFNEAVDQAIAESVGFFAAEVERWRNVFLGILGHELRAPLSAILMASEMLGGMNMDAPIAKNVTRIVEGGQRMRSLLDDLLDFNRSSFGLGVLISRKPVDLAEICENEIRLVGTSWPKHQISFTSTGNPRGSFDGSRVREMVSNLVTNAAKYGDGSLPIEVRLVGDESEVRISVLNGGPAIPGAKLDELFEPLRRVSAEDAVDGSLGLGLFVVKQLAIAHGGDVEVRSSDGSTEFSFSLHRNPAPPSVV